MSTLTSLQKAFAPAGVLRASINLGNPLLVRRAPETSAPVGVSIDLAQALAKRLGLPLELVVFETAKDSVEAVRTERADIGFFAIDPLRGEGISFTAPYLLIEGSYMVADGSAIRVNEDVDRPGIRVTVGKGSAYDLFLTRELKHAEIVRAPSSPAVVEVFAQQRLDVAAGVRQQLEADLARWPGHRLLPGRFMVIQQAMGMPQSRGAEASAYLSDFVEEMKSSGFVSQALGRHGVQGASLAPLAQK